VFIDKIDSASGVIAFKSDTIDGTDYASGMGSVSIAITLLILPN
jgi:hypothetical protein